MKIAIVGTHGVGKTTLMNRIAQAHPDWFFVEEQARKCPYPLNQGASYQTQRWILENQILRELECYALDYKANLVCDRSTIDQEAYIEWLYEHNKMSTREYRTLVKTAESWSDTYDRVFYLPIEFKTLGDEKRDASAAYQKDIDELVVAVLHRYPGACTLMGSVEERFTRFEELCQKKKD